MGAARPNTATIASPKDLLDDARELAPAEEVQARRVDSSLRELDGFACGRTWARSLWQRCLDAMLDGFKLRICAAIIEA